jgi:hypothetical protein
VNVAFAVAWLVPRTDVPTQFRLVPLNNASIGDREILVVNYRAGGSHKIRPNSTTRAS